MAKAQLRAKSAGSGNTAFSSNEGGIAAAVIRLRVVSCQPSRRSRFSLGGVSTRSKLPGSPEDARNRVESRSVSDASYPRERTNTIRKYNDLREAAAYVLASPCKPAHLRTVIRTTKKKPPCCMQGGVRFPKTDLAQALLGHRPAVRSPSIPDQLRGRCGWSSSTLDTGPLESGRSFIRAS